MKKNSVEGETLMQQQEIVKKLEDFIEKEFKAKAYFVIDPVERASDDKLLYYKVVVKFKVVEEK